MTTDGNDVNIAAEGANGGLDFYWAVNGPRPGIPSRSRARTPPAPRRR